MTNDDTPPIPDGATQVRAAITEWMLKAEDPSMSGKLFPVEGVITAGRDESCEIAITTGHVSRQHAKLSINNGVLEVEDLNSTNGTFINGNRVTKSSVNAGDEVRFDTINFRVIGPQASSDKTQMRPAIESSTALMDSAATQTSPTQPEAGSDGTQVMQAMGEAESEPEASGWRQSEVTEAGTRVMSMVKPCLLGVSNPFRGQKFVLDLGGSTVGRTGTNDICLAEGSISSNHAEFVEKNGSWRIVDQGSSNGSYVNGEKVQTSPIEPGNKIRLGRIEFLFELDDGTGMEDKIAVAVEESDSQKPGMPTWLYAVIAFVIVAAVMGVILFKDGKVSKTSKITDTGLLQISKQWATNKTGAGTPGTPAIGDVNGDSILDVVITDSTGLVRVLDGQDGHQILETNIQERIVASPAVVDLTRDGADDIIIGTQSGILLAINFTGQVIWKTGTNLGGIYNSFIINDLNSDQVPDVIVPTATKGLVAVDGSTGKILWESGSITKGKVITAPVMADLNHDGASDFLSLADKGHIRAFTIRGGLINPLWEYQAPPIMFASPLVSKGDGKSIVVIATQSNGLVAVDAKTGAPVWQALGKQSFFASPVAVDIDQDGTAEIIAITFSGSIHIVNADTGEDKGRINLGSDIQATPALFDVNKDSVQDLIVLDNKGRIQIINLVESKVELVGQVPGADAFVASPVLGDINKDSFIDIVATSQNASVFSYSLNRKAE